MKTKGSNDYNMVPPQLVEIKLGFVERCGVAVFAAVAGFGWIVKLLIISPPHLPGILTGFISAAIAVAIIWFGLWTWRNSPDYLFKLDTTGVCRKTLTIPTKEEFILWSEVADLDMTEVVLKNDQGLIVMRCKDILRRPKKDQDNFFMTVESHLVAKYKS